MQTDLQRTNFRHLYWDVIWFGVLTGSTMTFLAVFASRQGASPLQIGLLTAGPALINLFLSLPVGRWLENRSLTRITYLAAFWHRLPYFLLILIPAAFAPTIQILFLILVIVVMSLPGAVLAIAFNAMFADVVSPELRGEVVGRRNALLAVSIAASSLGSGQILDRAAFPVNYQIVFGLGSFGAMMSTYHLWRIRSGSTQTPTRIGKPLLDYARPGLIRFPDVFRASVGLRFLTRGRGKPLLRLDILRGAFGKFMFACLILYAVQYVPIPLFPIYYVNVLHLTDGEISLGSSLFYTSMLLTSLQIRWLTTRFGHRWILLMGAMIFSAYPLLLGLARDSRLFWAASFSAGVVWALVNAGLVNRLMGLARDDDRPAHMALHNLVLNTGILAGSIIGPELLGGMDLRQAVLLSAVLRFLGGLSFIPWG